MKKIFLITAAAWVLTACDTTGDTPEAGEAVAQVSAIIGESVHSRATDTSWAPRDRIGISACVGDFDEPVLKPYVNLEYITENGDSKFTGTKMFFYKPMTFVGYYPFTGEEGTQPGIIETSTTSDRQAPEEQVNIDFMYDRQTGIEARDPNIYFKFAHKMAKISIVFTTGEPYVDVGKIYAYQLDSLTLKGSFDTWTGECVAATDAAPESIRIEMEKGTAKDGVAVAPLIVFPQQLPGKAGLQIWLDEANDTGYAQHYTCTLDFGSGGLQAGHHYQFKVYVTKVGLQLGTASIHDWEIGKEGQATATVDGDPFEENETND